jgi:hypothetical protein
MEKQLHPVAIHRARGLVLWSDDSLSPILYAFDGDGQETTPAQGLAFVAHDMNGRWHSINGVDFPPFLTY